MIYYITLQAHRDASIQTCNSTNVQSTLHSLNRASWYIHVKMTNGMHTFSKKLFQLNYRLLQDAIAFSEILLM